MDTQLPEDQQAAETEPMFDAFELRVLAVLAEKESLTPDNYPLSVNALVTGCNQLTSRDPVMTLSEDTVKQVLQRLGLKKLVSEVSQAGARVPKYEHRMRAHWTLEQDKLAVLTVLALRGVQTAGEIRNRAGRLHDFASVEQVETALQFLIDKYPPLASRLPRAPGAKEARYAHLLSGSEELERHQVASSFSGNATPSPVGVDQVAQLEHEVACLRSELDSLRTRFDDLLSRLE